MATMTWQPTHRHYKGGLYREICRGLRTVYYEDEARQKHDRPIVEFDGEVILQKRRFEPLPPPPDGAEPAPEPVYADVSDSAPAGGGLTLGDIRAEIYGADPTPCNWVGGNDYAACTVCGIEYDYRKVSRPSCPRLAEPAPESVET